ncbi:TrkH family potassium uptake protein [Nocardioides bruguierae]|uniref:TrkH family potassium uptake protein n=1 Tax=Nocardioides bruguierae TaxID=2945102 RepID=A0A9X2D7A4_9ACTN|nr:potassium transporter TrkG [Nocardioides bruguierae]MCL8025635.1 TrkH family potassium uptake protein [Nocardioides bruguierae]MCM0620491.1 TrkH family potassium uptake protein [Nocardioides bruguierae]
MPSATFKLVRHPAQLVVVAFAVAVGIGTLLLSLPVATASDTSADWSTALFTATSALCVTGLVVVDTGGYWSAFGHVVIMMLFQVGGFGIMTTASLLGLLVSRKMGLRTRLSAAAEYKAVDLGDVRSVVKGVLRISLLIEAVIAVMLTLRFWLGYDESFGQAVWLGVFHAVSAFNNAGFVLFDNSVVGFATDPLVLLPIAGGVILGGIGFPVMLELRRHFLRPRQWSLHTRITLTGTVLLLVLGTIFMVANEWRNDATLGALPVHDRFLPGFFHAVMPRSGGFNAVETGEMHHGSLLVSAVLMFIGGGSASTAGGIKVTTFLLLFFVILAEVRGEKDVHVFGRRIGDRATRQALTVALLSVAGAVTGTFVLVEITDLPIYQVMFEAVSAFATVGLSTGITPLVGDAGEVVLVLLMFIGRLGPVTLVSALALRERQRLYQHPEGRPLIG